MNRAEVDVTRRIGEAVGGRLGARRASAVEWVGRDRSATVVGVVGLAAALWVGGLLVGRTSGLAASDYDLGFFQQLVWNVGQRGQWVSSFHLGSFLGLHFSPLLLVPAALERFLWSDVRVLNLLHAAAIGALVPAAFLLFRAVLRPSRAAGPMAAALAVGIPLWGATQEVIRADFHPETIGVVLAMLAGWAGLTRRSRLMWVLAILALTSREDVAYAVLVIGLLVAARGPGGMQRQGRFLAAVALGWGLIVFGVLMPWIRHGVVTDIDRYYGWLGSGPGLLLAPFTKGDLVFHAIARPTPWYALAGMIAALAGLPLLRPRWLLLAGPPVAAVLLSAHRWQADLLLQYPLILYVPLMVAAALGGRRAIVLGQRIRRRSRSSSKRRLKLEPRPVVRRRGVPMLTALAALLLTMPAIADGSIQGAIPPFDATDVTLSAHPGAIDETARFVAAIPPDVLLIADAGLVVPFAGRRAIVQLTSLATLPDHAYVLVDRSPALDGGWSPARRATELLELNTRRRPIVMDDGRFVLWGPVPSPGVP
ncbi:MAG: DUF2079 domain-containing protein [Chloroflexota bacterium]